MSLISRKTIGQRLHSILNPIAHMERSVRRSPCRDPEPPRRGRSFTEFNHRGFIIAAQFG